MIEYVKAGGAVLAGLALLISWVSVMTAFIE